MDRSPFRVASRRAALLFAGLLLASPGAHAATVFACRGADGSRVYQDRACGPLQRQSLVDIAPAPPSGPAPEYAVPAVHGVARRQGKVRAAAREREPASYECRADDGEVFYRHSACPRSIRLDGSRIGAGARKGGGASVQVTGSVVTRAEACRRVHGSGVSGRSGHERDDRVSTYDRNLGRDPCR